jgi:hypothetical protein
MIVSHLQFVFFQVEVRSQERPENASMRYPSVEPEVRRNSLLICMVIHRLSKKFVIGSSSESFSAEVSFRFILAHPASIGICHCLLISPAISDRSQKVHFSNRVRI